MGSEEKKDICKTRENNVMICIITDGFVSREACSIFLINTKLSPKRRMRKGCDGTREHFWNSHLGAYGDKSGMMRNLFFWWII